MTTRVSPRDRARIAAAGRLAGTLAVVAAAIVGATAQAQGPTQLLAPVPVPVPVPGSVPLQAQTRVAPLNRLPTTLLDVASPEQRVSGVPGQIRVENADCTPRGVDSRRARIIDIAVQEWAFFGFHVVDQTGPPPPRRTGPWRRRPWMDPGESARVAASIAGYWSVTPDGSWIIDRQNTFWSGPLGVGERWRDPWSAAFVSWTMCEAGVAPASAFRRSINHRTYIDQAIVARDAEDTAAAFVAYDVGEREIEPGDLLCSARRHGYRNLQDRRRHLGEGARTHCDIVVHVDSPAQRILAIGGNVRGRVSLKLLYARTDTENPQMHSVVGRGNRTIFAHLKLADASGDPAGLLFTPSIRAAAQDAQRRAAIETALQIELPAVEAAERPPSGSDVRALQVGS